MDTVHTTDRLSHLRELMKKNEAADARKLSDKIKKRGGKALVGVQENLVDAVWGKDRPPRPNEAVKVLGIEFNGKKFEEKLEDLRKELEKKNSPGFIVCMSYGSSQGIQLPILTARFALTQACWMKSRGFTISVGATSSIPYNPVFFSYAIVTPAKATLYIDSNKISDEVRSHLGDAVTVRPYDAIQDDIAILKETLSADPVAGEDSSAQKTKVKFLISNKTSWALSEALGGDEKVEEIRSLIADAKAIKNETELEGMRACHMRDGAALIEYFAWLEEELVTKETKLDEVEAADKLEEIRSLVFYCPEPRTRQVLTTTRKHKHFVGLSFDTISSTGPNAAVIHYKPERGNCSVIDPKAIYLCDSGGQYLDGTTDTTRTLHFGNPTDMERKSYTLVLKGNISLDRAVFPKGTSGFALDTLARQFLWEEGLDYRHGTGHGVGSYLNVHEGPIGIGTRIQYSEVALAAGNVLSNDIIMAREAPTTHKFGEKPYLGFEHVTMVPMCRKLIDEELLSLIEKEWLNKYHAEIFEKTKGFFEDDPRTLAWLERETKPIS
ncbi:hypothetical protein FGG08_004800 [Glutinoglossum americanum]|uniref:Probable Xaa-Pro aminopeptidase P n=1 Tax=Glutinoglossum americanum TaxID=1670608 RepID=A0A9P8I8G0_9PEZI|nr:hypothetical protein FGG08_004800 [Glutinoglossum americanum]